MWKITWGLVNSSLSASEVHNSNSGEIVRNIIPEYITLWNKTKLKQGSDQISSLHQRKHDPMFGANKGAENWRNFPIYLHNRLWYMLQRGLYTCIVIRKEKLVNICCVVIKWHFLCIRLQMQHLFNNIQTFIQQYFLITFSVLHSVLEMGSQGWVGHK